MSFARLQACRRFAENELMEMDAITAIRNYLCDDKNRLTLTDKQEEIYQRLRKTYSLLCEFNSTNKVVELLVKEYSMTERNAYFCIRDCMKLYGNVLEHDKKGMRNIVHEYAVETYRMARDANDLKSMATTVANMIKLHGLDREDADPLDIEKLEPSVIISLLPPEIENAFKQFLQGGYVDFNKLPAGAQVAEDVEHEVVNG